MRPGSQMHGAGCRPGEGVRALAKRRTESAACRLIPQAKKTLVEVNEGGKSE